MYEIVKIQRKIKYIRWTDSPNTWENSYSLNVRYRKNSIENYVHLMKRMFRFVEKFKLIQNRENSMENCVQKM